MFNTKNPLGYTIAVAIVFVLALSVVFTALAAANFALGTRLGMCLILISLAKDMRGDLSYLRKSIKCKKDRVHIIKQLSQFVRFHSNAIQ